MLSVADDEAGAVVAELTVSDPDEGDTHTFAVDDDRFEVVEDDGAYVLKLRDGVSLDFETETHVDVSVTVTDAAGASDTVAYSVAVDDANTAPEISLVGGEGLQASFYDVGHAISTLNQVDFNATPDAEAVVDSLDYMQGRQAFWDGAPDDFFAARYEGQLMVNDGGSYTFSLASDDGSMLFIDGVAVLDNDGLHGTRTRTVTLDLDAGAHDIEVRYFENGGSQTLQLAWSGPDTDGEREVIGGDSFRLPGFDDASRLGVDENAGGDIAAMLSITDAQGDAIAYEVNDDRFEIVETDDGLALKLKDGVTLDHEETSEITLTVAATDEHGESSSAEFTVPVADINESPTDILLSDNAVTENEAGAVVATLSAADPDDGDAASFSITQDDSGLFEIVGNELKLKGGVALDHEAQDAYDLTIETTDAGGATYAETVTINVADVNEAPVDFVLEPACAACVLSLNQDGGNDDVAIAANMEGFPTTALTVEVTFTSSQTDVGSGVPLFSYAADTGSNNEALIWLESWSGNVSIYLAGQRIATDIPNAALLDGQEHQVSFTWDQASNALKVYVDGEEEFATSVNIRDLRADGAVTFGQEQDVEGGRFDAGQVFEGEIAEARIFNYARTGEDIAGNAGGPLGDPGAEPGLVSNWVMNGEEDGAVVDLAGGNDLQLFNGAKIEGGETHDVPTVMENDVGAVVGVLSATDPDTGEPISVFSIVEDPYGLFEVAGSELKLKDGVSLDHEARDTYEITVAATDDAGASTTQTVTINVADIGEAPVDVSFSPVVANGVLSLNQDGGNDDYVAASNIDVFPADALTVEVSFASSQTDVGNGTPLFSYAANDGSNNEALIWLEGASGNIHVYLAGQRVDTGIPYAGLLNGETHNVAFSWDQTTNEFKFYVDGAEEFSTSVNIRDLRTDGTLVLGQEQDVEGGRFDVSQIFEGEIAEVRIFDYARSGQEIADHSGQPFDDPETEPGLVANWVMNNANDGAIEDLVGVNHLELHGDAAIIDSEFGAAPTVFENDAGAVVGTVSARDPQTGEPVTNFVIADDPSGLFELAGDQLKLKDGASLDYENQNTFDVVIEAVGAGGESTLHAVTVNVADVDETNYVLGDDRANVLNGGAGVDDIDGMGGNDRINGRGGDDVISGGGDRDYIRGGDGDDVIIGGADRDRLEGGDGDDVFVYEIGDGSDRIDGGDGSWTDTIQLSDGDAPLGEFGVDWTITITEGSIVATDDERITLSDDAAGVINLDDGSTISFSNIEEILI
jgi:archaellum component FlaF (FlaF/FlaG flagellin family)